MYKYLEMFYQDYSDEPKSAFGEQVFLDGVIRNHKRSQPVVHLMQAIYADFGKSTCEFSRRFVLDNRV